MTKVAAIQMKMKKDKKKNIKKAKKMVKKAIKNDAKVILLPELFEGHYFCKDKDKKYFSWAKKRKNNPLIKTFEKIAKKNDVVILVSYFEKDKDNYYNSLVLVDENGEQKQQYRKTHIPDGDGYEEKFYFKEGDTGFVVWDTKYGKIGAGICWDQWFCESARILTLKGADIIFYPTAIGSEPVTKVDSKEHWQRVQMGHSSANIIPVVAANRIGKEKGKSCSLDFYGSSFITNHVGEKIAEASRDKEEIIYAEFDFEKIKEYREYWGLIKDRRDNGFYMDELSKI